MTTDAVRAEETLDLAKEILDLAKRKGALKFGKFQLSAGGVSPYYFDGRLVTLDPEGANLVCEAMKPVLVKCGAEAVAGPELGADPIVSAVALLSHKWDKPISGLIVRKATKEHGAQRTIEGPMPAIGSRNTDEVIYNPWSVAVVDDTCTTGESLLHAIKAVEAEGARVVKVLCILDRNEGGREKLEKEGYNLAALLEADKEGKITPSSSWLSALSCGNANALYNVDKSVLSYTNGSTPSTTSVSAHPRVMARGRGGN